MSKLLKAIPLALAGFMAVSALSVAPTAAVASENCKRVTIKINNKSDKIISIRYAKIYDYQAKKWRTENLSNKELFPGQKRKEKATLKACWW